MASPASLKKLVTKSPPPAFTYSRRSGQVDIPPGRHVHLAYMELRVEGEKVGDDDRL